MHQYPSARALIRDTGPADPVTCLRPHAARAAARFFADHFPGKVLYAVKTNPRPEILNALFDAGIDRFDVASIAEVAQVRGLFPRTQLAFMHPVKSRDAIMRAYRDYGVRDFAFDSEAELDKILACTDNAPDLTLLLRLAVPNRFAEFDLSSKFGARADIAADLLLRARQRAGRLGVAFHVGSQCTAPSAYGTAIRMVRDLIVAAGVLIDVVDVGGGFPALYPDMPAPDLRAFMREIAKALETLPTGPSVEIWAEPGRALVAEAASTLVRVEHRRGSQLYINDGTFGSLFDAGVPGVIYPVVSIRSGGRFAAGLADFEFYGPTCDGMDHMRGPFPLPADISEGDYIEIGQTGAYGCTMRTNFNGFYSDATAILTDAPLMSLYGRGRLARPTAAGAALVRRRRSGR